MNRKVPAAIKAPAFLFFAAAIKPGIPYALRDIYDY
jgi:hypothetical protein